MTRKNTLTGTLLLFVIAISACSTGQQVTKTMELSKSADAPYKKILVITLLSSFDSRRYLEDEVVKQLSALGTDAVASTSMMNTKTPVTRQTFQAMVDKIGADGVVVTQLASLKTKGTVKDMNPEMTVNFRPTYYYNVWSVEQTEYLEPQAVDFDHTLVLATELYSVLKQDSVWAIESKTKITIGYDEMANYSIYVDEAKAIITNLSKDGLIE